MKSPKIILSVLLLICSTSLVAQQDAMHTQYVMNKLFVNPGYAGYKELPTITAIHRSQWLGFKGAPMTQVLSYDAPLKMDKLAIGATLMHDKLGPQRTTGFAADVAYRAKLGNRATLSFGAKASIEMYQANLTDLVLTSDYYGLEDSYFMNNTRGLFLPNIGFGLYYHKKNHFVGLSVPKMIRNKLERKGSDMYHLLNGRQEPTVYLMGGWVKKINRELKIQPNFMVKGEWGAPLSIGAHINGIYLDQFNVGVFYYHKETAGLMFQWQADKQLKVGYSMDFPVNQLISTGYGSHELALNYNISTKRKRIIYPKYF
ncbi:MAG: type IX secretion system membrane protein PorP/SprF [Flavobacteriales bacterium]|nr:type IX secretion system membrane protein PorP/SprF [Flavobacteriales bacterium]